MLPYTPLHFCFLQIQLQSPLVMTSGNLSEEPIAIDNEEARERLSKLADAFLMHDRDIHIRCDDSVVRIFDMDPQFSNPKSKIHLPDPSFPRLLPFPGQTSLRCAAILAVGSELKNTFCITNKNYAFLSHHIGDMENYETLQSFEQGVEHFEQLFRVRPAALPMICIRIIWLHAMR
jgi:hydrogenase maturation protein HypF